MVPRRSTRPLASLVGLRAWFEIRTSWTAMAGPGLASFVLSLLLPVQDAWIAAAAAGAFAAAFVLCIAIGAKRRQHDRTSAPDLHVAPRDVVLDGSSTIEQFGHAFGRVALVLAGFAMGVYAAQAFA